MRLLLAAPSRSGSERSAQSPVAFVRKTNEIKSPFHLFRLCLGNPRIILHLKKQNTNNICIYWGCACKGSRSNGNCPSADKRKTIPPGSALQHTSGKYPRPHPSGQLVPTRRGGGCSMGGSCGSSCYQRGTSGRRGMLHLPSQFS